MPKKKQTHSAIPKRMPNPADLRVRFPEIIALIRKEFVRRMNDMASGRAKAQRVKARFGQKYRNKGKKSGRAN